MEYKIIQTKSGHKSIEFSYNNQQIILNDKNNPLLEAEEICKNIFENLNVKYLLIIGSDFFYLLKTIIENEKIYNQLEKIILIDYWQELIDISIKESPNNFFLNDKKLVKFFNSSVDAIIDFFTSANINYNYFKIYVTKVSGTIYEKNQKIYKLLKERILITILPDLFQITNQLKNLGEKLELNDTTLIIFLMNEIISKFERKDLNYELL